MNRHLAKTLPLTLAAFLSIPAEFAQNQESATSDLSLEKETALGKRLALGIERRFKMLGDPVVVEYVERLVKKVVSRSDAKIPIKTRVIESKEAHAFALPGGFLFFSSGLIVRTETEAELAGVMAHEIAHVSARRRKRQAPRGALIKEGSDPLIFAGGQYGLCTRLAPGTALPIGYLPVARGFEKEADLLGLQFVHKAGYDPNGFVEVFERLHSGKSPELKSTTRRSWDKLQERLQPKMDYLVTTSEFNEVKGRLTAASRPQTHAHRVLKRSSISTW